MRKVANRGVSKRAVLSLSDINSNHFFIFETLFFKFHDLKANLVFLNLELSQLHNTDYREKSHLILFSRRIWRGRG